MLKQSVLNNNRSPFKETPIEHSSMYSIAPTKDAVSPKSSSERQTYFLQCAAKVATKSTMEHKHGAVIVHDNIIIASGFNYVYEHMYHIRSIHAEVDALLKVKSRGKHFLSEAEMYVVRIGTSKMMCPLKYSKPCSGCQKAIHKYGIKRVFYSTNDEYNSMVENMMQCTCDADFKV